MTARGRYVSTFLLAVTLFVADAARAESLITNGTFEAWQDGLPVDWTVGVGAQNGAGAQSTIRQITGRAVALEGNAKTKVWRYLSQGLAVKPGDFVRATFEAGAKDLRREGDQFDNCYVGLLVKDAAGERLALDVAPIEEAGWVPGSVALRVPDGAATAEVMIFLSKSGLLAVRNVAVERLEPGDSYRLLVDELGRHYSFFALKQIDWPKLAERYRSRAEGAANADEFAKIASEMLAELKDLHVTVRTPQGEVLPTHKSSYTPNFDFRTIAGQLQDVQQIGKIGFVGRTPDGFGYVAIGSLAGDVQTFDQLINATKGLLDAPGMIVDLRANAGGSETWARRLAGLFTDRPVVYAKHKFRSGPQVDDFEAPRQRVLEPATGKAFTRPVMCLIGPGCVSSVEGMALMFAALPHATLVGQPTRGASGNPGPLPLPNGVTVYYSRWVSLTPDGKPIEDRGVEPDKPVEHQRGGDPTFDAAVKLLAEQAKASR